ncbi:hypothetical protein AU693_003929 [Salmonella enterica subsp. diarizonae]|nr:hypothetical protein [Salmonella enterica subsp. diarizonae]EEP0994648.1 hypothetical protein [Salmonella enterica]
MARENWEDRQQQFLAEHARTGISPKDWCEAQGLNYKSAKRYIKTANSQKKTANQTANSQKGKTRNFAQEKAYKGKDKTANKSENSANSPETKPIRGSRYDPPTNAFTAHNTASLKHGAYARRRLLSDDVTIDTLNTELQGELFLVRAGNMLAVTEIGKWTAQMEDATPEEQKNLREQIAAAEKGIMRNIARIESIEFTLRNNLRVEAATAKLRAEVQKLTAENQGVTTPMTEILSVLHRMNAGRLDDIPEE